MIALHNFIRNCFATNETENRILFYGKQLALFGYLQALSCFFPVCIFLALALSNQLHFGIARYDLLLLFCLGIQFIMYKTGLETRDEVYVITLFHIIGLVLEIYKVNRGSWSYPEEAVTKIAGVPLYAGFMYASVGSFICQAWRNLELDTMYWPRNLYAWIGAAAIYLNFFTNSWLPDMRLYITLGLVAIFWRTRFTFRLNHYTYRMHALLSFLLIGIFIWLAENIATFLGAWRYASQHAGWKMVSIHKITSWGLLVIISIILVGQLKRIKENRTQNA